MAIFQQLTVRSEVETARRDLAAYNDTRRTIAFSSSRQRILQRL
jgi:hypothetical protein